MGKIIQIEGLTHVYNNNQKQKVLDDIKWSVYDGEFVSIQGKSGSGKSTFLHILGALLHPTSGEVIVDGTKINQLSEKGLAKFRRKTIGFVFQSYHLFQNMTACKNVEEPLLYSGIKRKDREALAKDMLRRVGLEQKIYSKVNELSGGQQQRVSIARAMINNPKIIMADEPTGNLDGLTEKEIISLFMYMNQTLKKTLIVVTHNDIVANYATKKMLIDEGNLRENV